jgi:hypothetical protein
VADGTRQRDGLLAARPGGVVVAPQPVGVRAPGQRVHVGPGADGQGQAATGENGGELELMQRLGRAAEADGRATHREVRRPVQLRSGHGGGQGTGGHLVAVGHTALHEAGGPQPEHADDPGVIAAERLGQRDGAL